MRTAIFKFRHAEVPLAELHLQIEGAGGVSKWEWHGDLGAKKSFQRLPNNRHSLYEDWYCTIMHASEDEGLSFTVHGEGDPTPTM